ncbi:hypothetical protein JVT61DRAFT_10261 [Boletus reticuloceps]|uniref:J domain-containing protein n=1 Tax=Boletus reticuloceps TaxID=495285 RepID=A0A8I2YYX7_9AGAM|nr:hypothetical protein JVT61DRAFT_10261 [Boletus reticuloceps]
MTFDVERDEPGRNFDMASDADTRDYLYAVLNLPNTASQNEIRERYRALSVIFHPDKQHDERTRDTAASKFLDIQKAYEVLSDPFLRQIYDRLGPQGLKWKWPAELRSKDNEEIKAALDEWEFDRRHDAVEQLLQPRGSVTCSINASSLFASGDDSAQNSHNVLNRIRGIGLATFGVRQNVTKRLGPKTTVALTGHSQTGSRNITRTLTGTLQHQFTPRFALELTAGFLKPYVVAAATTYNDNDNAVVLRTGFVPTLWRALPPFLTLSVGRRLFRHSPTQGSATWTFSPGSPTSRLELHVHSSKPFDLTSPEEYTPAPGADEPMFDNGPGSITGFGAGVGSWSYGLVLHGLESCFTVNYSVFLHELALRLKAGVEIGFPGAAYSISAKWSGKRTAFSTYCWSRLSYLRQKWTLPIVLSPENNETLALYSIIIPSTALALGYHFILKPRRRAQRATYFDAARRALKEERSAVMRESENTGLLLREPARRHMDAERAIGGLVILEATYGPTAVDEDTAGLHVDVTIPLQALVHKSQLYVSNKVPKSGIQGFCDPAPETPKSLRVRYVFRDQMHYAEIPDLMPIVLPLRDHLVV